MDYNYIDLFHGIGGFALGAHWAGMKFENHFCSDIEKYTVELYKKRFPDSIQLGDITKIDFEKLKKDYPGEWILTGGFPCQDISVAGKGVGIYGKRSSLWFEYWKGISILRPKFAIVENVRALLNRGLETVLGSLSIIGYNAEWQIISAENMGAPHKRERVWIIAYPNNSGKRTSGNEIGKDGKKNFREIKDNSRIKFSRYCENKMANSRSREQIRRGISRCRKDIKETRKGTSNNVGRKSEINDVAYPSSMGCKSGASINRKNGKEIRGSQFSIDSKSKREIPDTSKPGLQRQESKRRNGRKSGLSSKCNWWSTEPAVGRLVNGLSGRVDRLKGLGNAIVPKIAELLFNQIKDYL